MVNIVFEIYKQHKGLCILCYKILFGKLTYGIFKSTGQAIKNFEQEVILPKILICNILTRHLIKNYQAKYFVCWPDAWVIWNAPVPLLHLSYIITSIPDLTSLVRWCCLSHILFGFCTLFANLRFQNIELQV